jgi:hypothetical protein
MHLLLLDQHPCGLPGSLATGLCERLRRDGQKVSLCRPVIEQKHVPAVNRGEARDHGIDWPIPLDAGSPSAGPEQAWARFLQSLGRPPMSLTAAAAALPEALQGTLRERIRKAVTAAVDGSDVDAIFVAQAGLLLEFAIETGPPVAVHAGATDLLAMRQPGRLREIAAAALGSCDLIAADDASTADELTRDWIEADPERPVEVWPLADSPERIVAACRTALARRFGR